MATAEVKKVNAVTPETANKLVAAKAENNDTEIDLVALFYRILEKAHWIILCALIGAVIAGVLVFKFVTPIYQATSKIYIVGSDTTISLSDLQIGSNLAADYQEVFKNWHVHELVDKRLNLDYSYNKLSGMLSISNPSGTHVIYVSIKSPDPQEAKLIADTYAQVAREFIAAKMDMREPNIFEEAKLPDKPVSPQKARSVIIGFLIGALLAMAMVTIKFLSDDRICTTEDIAKVGNLPTLGLIPLQNTEQDAGKRNNKGGKE